LEASGGAWVVVSCLRCIGWDRELLKEHGWVGIFWRCMGRELLKVHGKGALEVLHQGAAEGAWV